MRPALCARKLSPSVHWLERSATTQLLPAHMKGSWAASLAADMPGLPARPANNWRHLCKHRKAPHAARRSCTNVAVKPSKACCFALFVTASR